MQYKHYRVEAIRQMRGRMWSPGRPSTAQREDRVRFWEAVAREASTDVAAARRWDVFRCGSAVVPRVWWHAVAQSTRHPYRALRVGDEVVSHCRETPWIMRIRSK